MSHAIRKRQNLENIELILWDNPGGLTRSELARRIKVDPGTITKYYDNGDLPHVYDEDGKLKLNRYGNLARVVFDLDEITILHIAARLLIRQTNQHNPHVASILRKLSSVIGRTDEEISRHLSQAANLADSERQVHKKEFIEALHTLTEARTKGRKVTLEYEVEEGKWIPYTFSPYFIEPYAPGLTTHVIGLREPPNQIRTFKLERLRNTKLAPQNAVPMPTDFDPEKLLEHAWGIWYTDEDPELVELKFSPHVKRRVLETRWHRHQAEPEVLPDGAVIWRCRIAEPKEMLYWIRGWGADVEVIGPQWLRDNLMTENRKQAKMYGISQTTVDPRIQRVLRCWGKTGNSDDIFHPAFYHILDVAHVANELLQPNAPPRFRQILASILHTSADSICQWLPYFVALHDIGKFSAAFQGQNETQKTRLQKEGFPFRGWSEGDFRPHGVISQVFLEETLAQAQPTIARNIQRMFAEMIGGHHGEYVSRDFIKSAKAALNAREPVEWTEIRLTAEMTLRNHFLKCELSELPEPPNVSTAVMALTGFTILCDWLGSDQRFFKPQPEMDLEDYMRLSQRQAHQAVQSAHLLTPTTSTTPTDFRTLFSDLFQEGGEPRPLQLAIDLIPETILQSPCLVIIEAPTGEGKTEAAFALAHRLAQAGHGDDLYYALPTMATSNQMFDRLQHHLVNRLDISTQVKLVHGQAFLIEDNPSMEPLNNGSRKEKGDPRQAALQWFSSKKRALLAPFGVGTIDQAELATLNVRHAALRMIGLTGKVVIIDEVHAYDTYMTTIIEQLLRWLSALGTSVILLSATLPLSRRSALAEAYGVGLDESDTKQATYPSLLVLSKNHPPHWDFPKAWQSDRTLTWNRLEMTDEQAEEKARWLLDAASNGGCICWMTNTVKRSQDLFDLLQKLAPPEVELSLLHSQFPLEDRQRWEQELRDKYGRKGARPRRAIVVGTQVLEQSLDLDFDLLVSDLAPIDLLLQRAGRLHRHDRPRPPAHNQPCLWINAPSRDGELALSGADIEIYTEYILRQTWSVLTHHRQTAKEISLPTDYRPLIEAVYATTEPLPEHPLRKAWDKLRTKSNIAREKAAKCLMPEPDPKTPFSYAATEITFEENENSAAWIVAQTRLGEESLNIIPLEVQDDVGQLPDGTVVDLNQEAPREIQLRLLRRNLRISNYDAIGVLKAYNIKPKPLFRDSALLKDYYLLPLHDNKLQLDTDKHKINFTLHPRLGLMIRKEKK